MYLSESMNYYYSTQMCIFLYIIILTGSNIKFIVNILFQFQQVFGPTNRVSFSTVSES